MSRVEPGITEPRLPTKSDKYLKFLDSFQKQEKHTSTLDKLEKQPGYNDNSRPPRKPAKDYNNRNKSLQPGSVPAKVKASWQPPDPNWAVRAGKHSDSSKQGSSSMPKEKTFKGQGGAAKAQNNSRINTGATKPPNTGSGYAYRSGSTSSVNGANSKQSQRPLYSQSTLKKTQKPQKRMNVTPHSLRDGMKERQGTLTRPGNSGPGSARTRRLTPNAHTTSLWGGQGTLTRPGSKGSSIHGPAKASGPRTRQKAGKTPGKTQKAVQKAAPRQRTKKTSTPIIAGKKKGLINMWDNKFEEFAAGSEGPVRLRPGDHGYGVPVGKTAERGIAAKKEMEQGMDKLLQHIKGMGHKDSQGYYVTFGELFLEYEQISSNLVYYLQLGKKRKYLTYEDLPGTLFQGKHDHIVIRLLK